MRPRLVDRERRNHIPVIVQKFTKPQLFVTACLTEQNPVQEYGHLYRAIPSLPKDKSENLG